MNYPPAAAACPRLAPTPPPRESQSFELNSETLQLFSWGFGFFLAKTHPSFARVPCFAASRTVGAVIDSSAGRVTPPLGAASRGWNVVLCWLGFLVQRAIREVARAMPLDHLWVQNCLQVFTAGARH